MDLDLNETQRLVQKTARDYATRVIQPQAADTDKHERFPREILKGLGDLGLLAVNVPEEYGGAGAGAVAYALAMQEVARACASTAVTMAVTNMVGEVIARFGTEEQRRAYCPKLANSVFAAGAFALSEPGAGSDPGGMSTTATFEGRELGPPGREAVDHERRVRGRDGRVGAHRGARDAPGHARDLVLPRGGGAPGLKVGKPEDKMGIRGSNTVGLEFDGVRVPESALLGELNGGFKIAMMALDGGRIGISAQAIGIARAALEEAVRYAKDRKQFGHAIASYQAIQWKLADAKTELDAAHLLCMRAACLKEAGQPFSREASMAKLFASEAANRICNDAVQIHGGYGYTREFAAERHLRDVRVTTIYEGTSEVQRIVIARSVLQG